MLMRAALSESNEPDPMATALVKVLGDKADAPVTDFAYVTAMGVAEAVRRLEVPVSNESDETAPVSEIARGKLFRRCQQLAAKIGGG